MITEKEQEIETKKLEDSKKNFRLYSKFYEDILPEATSNLFNETKAKFMSFTDWNLESVNDKCMLYSSKSTAELIEDKTKLMKKVESTRMEFKNSQTSSETITGLFNANRRLSVCIFLLSLYLLVSVNGWSMIANPILCILIPLMVMTAVDISQETNGSSERPQQSTERTSWYKVKTKCYAMPDDIAFALCKPNHRKHWDMGLVSFLKNGDSSIFNKDMSIQYQSQLGGTFSEDISYNFYLEDEGIYYILEETTYDRFKNEKTQRLIELKAQTDRFQRDYYTLTIYGESRPHIMSHKGEEVCKLDFIKGLVTYVENSEDLPSSQVPLHLRKSSSFMSDSERPKYDGKIRFSFKKRGESLDPINESAELVDDSIEEYKVSMINVKDTLLTVDEFCEGESEDYGLDLEGKIYDEVDEIMRKESDDIMQIKKEAVIYDSNERINLEDDCDVPDTFSEDDGDIIKEDDNLASSKAENIRIPTSIKLEKDSNGAVVSPFKGTTSINTLGISTFDPDWKPQFHLNSNAV